MTSLIPKIIGNCRKIEVQNFSILRHYSYICATYSCLRCNKLFETVFLLTFYKNLSLSSLTCSGLMENAACYWIFMLTVCSAMVVPNCEGIEEKERILRERRPNSQNIDELLMLMTDTREVRRHWIATSAPDATTIIRRYPRFVDTRSAVSAVNMMSVNIFIFTSTLCYYHAGIAIALLFVCLPVCQTPTLVEFIFRVENRITVTKVNTFSKNK